MRSSLFAVVGIAAAVALPLGAQAEPNAPTINPTGNATGTTNPDNMANPNSTNNAANQSNTGGTASNNEPNSNEHASNVIRSELERAGFKY